MEQVEVVFTWVAHVVDILGVMILLYGFAKVLVKYVAIEFSSLRNTPIRALQRIRCEVGIYILLALDFLIASDIIHTITNLTQKQLIELSVMIVLRTAIGYFLGREVNELESEKE
jgi:uncharacterized membrane protein